MMKKRCLVLFFGLLAAFCAFGETGKQEEVDFLLFLPNSGNQFVNEAEAMLQLDCTADYLMVRGLGPGKISVYGYAAAAVNGIEPVNLSRDRALHVINELQKRGLGEDLFAEPVACGSVDLWGGNTSESDRSLNRRVRILVDDTVPAPAALKSVDTRAETPGEKNPQEAARQKTADDETAAHFPWWILLLMLAIFALLAAIVSFFASRRRRKSTVIGAAATVPAALPNERVYVLTEEEIRRYAYKLYQRRNGQNEDADEDWYRSESELTAHYEFQGYWVILYWEIQAPGLAVQG